MQFHRSIKRMRILCGACCAAKRIWSGLEIGVVAAGRCGKTCRKWGRTEPRPKHTTQIYSP